MGFATFGIALDYILFIESNCKSVMKLIMANLPCGPLLKHEQ